MGGGKIGLVFGKWRVVAKFLCGEAFVAGRESGLNCTNKKAHMKKIILLATLIGISSVLTSSAADVKELWEKSCAKCHGADGKGQTKMGQKLGIKDYTAAKVQEELKDDAALKAIKEGLKDKDGKTLMKPTEGVTDDEAKALVAHMRSFKK